MGELRDRMVQDMQVRDFSPRTQEAYLAAVTGLAAYYRKAPDLLSDDEIQRYLLHGSEERQLSASTRNQIRGGLKFFSDVTLRRPQAALTVPVARQPQKLPAILTPTAPPPSARLRRAASCPSRHRPPHPPARFLPPSSLLPTTGLG